MSDYSRLPRNVKPCFPRHGWTCNVAGIRQLRLPIMRLYQFASPHYEIYNAHGLAGIWLQCHSPNASIRLLAVCLRDMSAEFRVILATEEADWSGRPVSNVRNRALTRRHEALERSEVLLISALVLLRRLADQIIDATRPLLFVDWQSAPRQLKTAVSLAKTGRLYDFKTTCDMERLVDALLNKTAWFDALRKDEGIRDILVHKEHYLSVGSLGTQPIEEGEYSWQVTINLMRPINGKITNIDIAPILRSCIEGMCDFMEAMYTSLHGDGDYAPGDTVFLTGEDVDVTAFWPELERGVLGDA